MAEHPILFTGDMVRAILDGRKTQTRRVIKPQPWAKDIEYWRNTPRGWSGWKKADNAYGEIEVYPCHFMGQDIRCPYGKVGDKLWVRETWRVVGWQEGEPLLIEYKDGKRQEENDLGDSMDYEKIYEKLSIQSCEDCIKAGIEPDEYGIYAWPKEQKAPTRWRPSIFMPKWACRLRRPITNIRAERVQDISEEDARAEGISVLPLQDASDDSAWWQSAPGVNQARTPKASFCKLWDSINAKRNSWVWVVEFKRITDG